MGIILFDINQRMQRVQKESVTELLWYDQTKKEMRKFLGGQLDFKYNFATKELEVKAVPLLVIAHTKSSDEANITNWIDANADDFDFEYVDGGIDEKIAVSFPDDMKTEIEDSLSETLFDYEIL